MEDEIAPQSQIWRLLLHGGLACIAPGQSLIGEYTSIIISVSIYSYVLSCRKTRDLYPSGAPNQRFYAPARRFYGSMLFLWPFFVVGTAYAEESDPVSSSDTFSEYKSIPLSQRLHIVLLGVSDVQRSAGFYDSLGWSRATDSHAGFVKYDLGGFAIALISIEDFAKDANYASSDRAGFPGIALIYLAKTEGDVEKILKKAVDSGGELIKAATVTPYGVAGYFRDPDGHLFEVDYEGKFKFTADHQLITE